MNLRQKNLASSFFVVLMIGVAGSGMAVRADAQQEGSTQNDGAPMVEVPGGEFIMGSISGGKDELPASRVQLDAFSIDKHEVTVGQYAKFLEAKSAQPPKEWNVLNQPQHQRRPMVYVDWTDADRYCQWAGKRLPTEAEWEKAARGPYARTYPWGSEEPTSVRANFGQTNWDHHMALIPVDMPNEGGSPYGIEDMAGNVWEWTSDWYDGNYYQTRPATNPKGPSSGELRVLRGGSWLSGPDSLRSATRLAYAPSTRFADVGFRCAKGG
ncbi:hypothetical protein YTPLAS18_29090 [Nitrospira sp.]|nr:hypothetical protein YTPLAS18_29090 [Nitrospira sp.]